MLGTRSGDYKITDRGLHGYLIPKRPIEVTPQELHEKGRGIGYAKSPFAYLFQHRTTDLAP